jgi:hypothetical protein
MPFSAQTRSKMWAPRYRREASLLKIGESHAVVGKYRMDSIGIGFDDVPQKVGTIHFAGVFTEFGIGELRDPVDRQEHVNFAFSEPQLADIDVDIADRSVREPTSFGSVILALWQARDAVPLKASVETGARKLWNGVLHAAKDIIERQQCSPAKLDNHRFLDRREHVLLGSLGPMGASAVVVRDLHLATVVRLKS